MALSIQSQALRAGQTARYMAWHTQQQARAAERASSGYRVNRAGDDAAGLSISESMNAQMRGTLQASRNILDGISLLNVADAAVSQIANALHRMRELAVQSANGTYADSQRQSLELEFQQLRAEIDYATREANYNGYFLLRGGSVPSYNTLTRSVSDVSTGTTNGPFTITPPSVLFPPASQTLNGLGETQVSLGAAVPEVYGLGTAGPQSIVVEATDSVTGVTRPITFDAANGFTYDSTANQLTFHGTGTPSATETVNVRYVPAGSTTRTTSGTPIAGSQTVTANGVPVANAGGPGGDGFYAVGNTVSLVGAARPDAGAGTFTWSTSYMTEYVNTLALDTETPDYAGGVLDPASLVVTVNGVPVPADPANGYSLITTQTDEVGGQPLYSYEIRLNGTSQVSGAGPHTIQADYDFDVPAQVDPLEFVLQEGANMGETKSLSIDRLTVGGLGLGASHVDSQADASAVLSTLETSLTRMNMLRAKIGAYQNTLDHAYKNVLNMSQQQAAGRSHIRDADMAFEVSESTRATILRDGAMGTFQHITSNANFLVQLLG